MIEELISSLEEEASNALLYWSRMTQLQDYLKINNIR